MDDCTADAAQVSLGDGDVLQASSVRALSYTTRMHNVCGTSCWRAVLHVHTGQTPWMMAVDACCCKGR